MKFRCFFRCTNIGKDMRWRDTAVTADFLTNHCNMQLYLAVFRGN